MIIPMIIIMMINDYGDNDFDDNEDGDNFYHATDYDNNEGL
jgi:hypothetical protein